MDMIQAYQGYFKDEVQLIADNSLSVKIPTNRKLTILWEEIPANESIVKTDGGEIAKRREMVQSLKGCLAGLDIDLDEIRGERIARRGLL